MTVPVSTVGAQRNRAPATRPDRAGRATGRSGAALRAYERRQQRASVHTSDSGRSSGPATRQGLNGSAIAARIPFVALIIGMLGIGLGLTLLLTTRSAGDSYDLSAAKTVNAELAQERASLQRDVELAESAPELARKAAELGMVPAKNSARLLVAPDGGVQVVGEPKPADGAPVAPLDPTTTAQSTASASDTAQSARTQSTTQQLIPRSASQPNASQPNGTQPNGTQPNAVAGSVDTRAGASATPPNTVQPGPAGSNNATPNAVNGAESRGLAEQLVPMSIPSADSSGNGQ